MCTDNSVAVRYNLSWLHLEFILAEGGSGSGDGAEGDIEEVGTTGLVT